MKRVFSSIIVFCAIIGTFIGCSSDDTATPGSIYGVVTDKATGEPLKSAGVELLPLGLRTVTGSEGQFEFVNIDAGSYTLNASKSRYADKLSSTITVKSGQSSKCDFQLELLPPALKVVDDSRHEISELVFDNSESDVSRSFNIFNDGAEKLEWEISASADWIKSFSKENGLLAAGATQSIIITIDREKLNGGEDVTTIHVTSDNGSKQITVKVISDEKTLAKLNTLEVSDIHLTTAGFNGEIIDAGTPSYTERGFVYATSSMPTIENTIKKLTVAVNNESKFSYKATGLEDGKTYYVRAYAINKAGTAYSTNEVSFKPQKTLPTVTTEAATNKSIGNGRVTLNGNITYAGEPAYTEKGFVYGTSHNPSVEDDTKKTVSGSGTGVFSANLTNLSVGNVYYARAYAKSLFGTAYGTEIELDFKAILPTLTTDAVSDITATSAMLNGTILTVGDPAYTERGFVYGTMPIPSLDESEAKKVTASGLSIGRFSKSIINFDKGITYYVRAYAKNSANIVYGNIESFKYEDLGYTTFEADGIMVQNIDLGSMNHDNAVSACRNSQLGGFNDWRLPSLIELISIYNHYLAGEISGFSDTNYWAYDFHSSKYEKNWLGHYVYYYYYCFVDFSTGDNSTGFLETQSLKVRAVRTITN